MAASRGPLRLSPLLVVWFWHPGDDGSSLAPYEAWLWRETLAYYREAPPSEASRLPPIIVKRSALGGGLDQRSGLATALVLFGLFFVCVYMQSSLTCEE